jgi:hypothetical protein
LSVKCCLGLVRTNQDFKGPSPLTRFSAPNGAILQMDALLCRTIVPSLHKNASIWRSTPSRAQKRSQKTLLETALKGPFPLAIYARVSPSTMAPPPNCFLCFSRAITRVIAREKQRDQLGGSAIAEGAVYTRVFCSRFSVRDGAAAKLVPLLFSYHHARDRARKAKEAVGRRRHHGRRNASKKRKWKRPLKPFIRFEWLKPK